MYWPPLRPFGRKSDVAVGDSDPLTAFRREMERLFDSFGRDLGWLGSDIGSAAMTPESRRRTSMSRSPTTS
jgi:hypothetical protein